ncbi:MAG TPA: hypothetical protein VFG87_15215 [Amycolatopsis sp.]|jgi:hypothetical protein|nr:hypothetical protein [Amycolatopsis sp.]
MPDDEFIAYFELRSEHGVDHANNLQPIVDFGLSMPAARQTSDGLILPTATERVSIQPAPNLTDELVARVIPNTRIVETIDPRVADAIRAVGLFDEIDKPSKTAIAAAEKETRAHVDAMAARDRQVDAGGEPPPDATDAPTPDAVNEEG